MPDQYRKQILTALSYFPELENVHIVFRIAPQYTPFTTRPNLVGIFKRKNHRTYVITISNKTIDTLTPLLMQNLSFDAQVGVIGHELSHVVDFNHMNFFQNLWNGLGHLSEKHLDKMEFNTDRICVMHGLGAYLEVYSKYVRQMMHVQYWRGVDHVFEPNVSHERYMNPGTIEKYMTMAAHQ